MLVILASVLLSEFHISRQLIFQTLRLLLQIYECKIYSARRILLQNTFALRVSRITV